MIRAQRRWRRQGPRFRDRKIAPVVHHSPVSTLKWTSESRAFVSGYQPLAPDDIRPGAVPFPTNDAPFDREG